MRWFSISAAGIAIILALAITCVPLCQAQCQPQKSCPHPCCPTTPVPNQCDNGVTQPAAATSAFSVAPSSVVLETLDNAAAQNPHQARPTPNLFAFPHTARTTSAPALPIPLRI
ncbi:MAG: hypothetical protein WA414_14070 [Acidobacteriaceae bacterium]